MNDPKKTNSIPLHSIMVIGKVLPDNINGTHILGESTTTNNNKYVSRLPTISPIKFTNSISIDSTRSSLNHNDIDEYEQDTTTIIHNSNNKNFNKNIFTPNTATTAVDSNDSRQDLKLKKLRQFSETIQSGKNDFDDVMINHKNLQPQQINFVDDNNYYGEDDEGFENDEVYEYNGINDNDHMEYLREKEKMLELEQRKLLLEKEQMKLRISRSASLRNFKNLSPKKHNTSNNFMLSRSSSIHSNIHDFVQPNERQSSKLNNAKSMLNLRPTLNNKKSTQNNGKHKEYQDFQPPAPRKEMNFPRYKSMGNLRINSMNDDNKIQRKQSMYLRPRVSSNSLYEQKLRKKPSYYSTQSNLQYDSSPRHLVNDQSPRHRISDDEYRPLNEEPSGIYNIQGDYLDEESEEEYDETFYEDFDMNANNNHKLLMNYKPNNQQTPVDYWSVPKELFSYEDLQRQYNLQYDNKKYMRVKLKPIQKQNMHKELHLKNFEERYSNNNKYYTKMKVYDPSLYMNKIKDGYVSGMMRYDGKEKRWLGGDKTMDYLPDFDSFQSNNYGSPVNSNLNNYGKAKNNYHKPKISMSNIKMKSYPSMKNLKLSSQKLDINIDTNFNAGVLSKWYAYENDIQVLSDRWVGDVEVDEWEIYDLVRSST